MNFKLLILSLIVVNLSISCSSDDSSTDTKEENIFGEIKTKKFISEFSNSFFPDEIDFYNYTEDGLLINLTGGRFLSGTYNYDDNKKLISKTREISGETFTYEYDNQNRIIKQNLVGTNEYIKFLFENNKVISERLLETVGGDRTIEKKELLLDNQGRIKRVNSLEKISIRFNPNELREELEPFFDTIEYEYDSRGNIIEINTDGSVEQLSYDNSINPFYVAFKKHYEINYFIDNFFGLRVFQTTGLTPNNLVNQGIETITYEYDDDNYPVSWKTLFSVDGVSEPERFLKYKK